MVEERLLFSVFVGGTYDEVVCEVVCVVVCEAVCEVVCEVVCKAVCEVEREERGACERADFVNVCEDNDGTADDGYENTETAGSFCCEADAIYGTGCEKGAVPMSLGLAYVGVGFVTTKLIFGAVEGTAWERGALNAAGPVNIGDARLVLKGDRRNSCDCGAAPPGVCVREAVCCGCNCGCGFVVVLAVGVNPVNK